MTSTTAVHTDILEAIEATGLHVVFGPADDLPAGPDGRVEQAAILYPDARLNRATRISGGSSAGFDTVVVGCVGATIRDALAAADRVHVALNALQLSPKGSPLQQTARTSPAPEVNADPVRVYLAVEYSTITKD